MKKRMSKEELADALSEYIKENGMTIESLAKYLDIPQWTIRRWLNEKVTISPIMQKHLERMKVLK